MKEKAIRAAHCLSEVWTLFTLSALCFASFRLVKERDELNDELSGLQLEVGMKSSSSTDGKQKSIKISRKKSSKIVSEKC